jgi:hypothetical protein
MTWTLQEWLRRNGCSSAEGALTDYSELDDVYPGLCSEDCQVEPDEHCPYGAPSLLLALGLKNGSGGSPPGSGGSTSISHAVVSTAEAGLPSVLARRSRACEGGSSALVIAWPVCSLETPPRVGNGWG